MGGRFEFNPWLKIFVKPRQTIRAIVDVNPNFRLFVLSAIYGFCSLLGVAQNFGLGDRKEILAAMLPLLLLAPVWGYLVFSFSSWFVFIMGKLLKGQGSYRQVRAAYAWSNVPLIVNAFLWILLIVVFRSSLFSETALKGILTQGSSLLLIGVVFSQLIFSLWGLVIYVIGLSEVQRFSILKTLVNLFLSLLLFFILALTISLILVKISAISTV